MIEAYRAEHAQTEPKHVDRYYQAFHEASKPFFDKLCEKWLPRGKTRVDAAPLEEEKTAPMPQLSERDRPREKESSKPDLSFVRKPAFQDALCKLARYERQLTEELSRTLSLLPRNRTKAKKSSNSGVNNLEPPMASDQMVIYGEDAQQFGRLRAAFKRQLKPQTTTERELVERIVGLSWRLRRIPAFEAALMEAARAEFKPQTRKNTLWAVDSPNHPLFDRFFLRDGKPATMTAAERETEWRKTLAWRKEIEDQMLKILGDERQEILPDLWFMRERDVQEKLGRLARYEVALARQLACTRKLLHLLQACRMGREGAPD